MGKIIAMLMGAAVSANVLAQPSPDIGTITSAADFPVEKLIYFEADNGDKGIMSDNGRFVIVGDFKVVDTWTQKTISDVEGVKAMKDLPIAQLKEPLEKTAHFIFGHGDEDVFIFTDLSSKMNQGLFTQFDDSMLSKYRFHVVYSSIVENKYSLPVNRAFLCSTDPDKAKGALSANIGDSQQLLKALSAIGEKSACNLDPLMNSALLGKSAGVKRVPFVVNSLGKTKVYPSDLKGFLNE